MTNILWVSLFVFLLCTTAFWVSSIVSGKPYWRFGIGFGLGFAASFPLAEILVSLFSSWLFPALLFIGVPLILISLSIVILLSVLLGIIFYGRKRWEEDKEGIKI